MRRLLLTLLAVLLAAAFVGPQLAVADDDDDDDDGGASIAFGDFITNFAGAPQHVEFTARDGGLPPADSGEIHYTNFAPEPDFSYTAELVCVSITLNTARFGYRIPPGTNQPALTGTPIVWQVQDNSPEGSNPSLDQAGWVIATPETCDVTTVPMQPITEGDIVVRQGGLGGDDDDDDEDDDEDDDD